MRTRSAAVKAQRDKASEAVAPRRAPTYGPPSQPGARRAC